MLNIGLSIVQNRVASSLSTVFADFGANPSIIAAVPVDLDPPDGMSKGVLEEVAEQFEKVAFIGLHGVAFGQCDREGDALRATGGPRRVDDVGQVSEGRSRQRPAL